MNVSSVKNLNGEVLSAVQDAYLTNVVQTNSAQWAEGGVLTGDYVSGVNLVKEPYEEGGVRGTFCSANVSGDVTVTVGEYDSTSYMGHRTYSLYSLGTQFNDKLDSHLISDSKTLASLDGSYQVFEKAYRNTGTATASADNVTIDGDGTCYIDFNKSNYLRNCTIIVESNTEGIIDESLWESVSYENNSATLKKYYKPNSYLTSDHFVLGNWDGWNITNCDATCTTYTGVEIAELAFKDELPTYEYDNTNKISAINGSALAGGGNTEVESYVVTNSASIDDTVGYVQTNSATINDVNTSYQTNSGTFLTAHQAISAEEWNGCYDNVNANSGAWGGSALPISAGQGVGLSVSDDKLVIRAVPKAFYTIGISDIILTASLPVSPNANTLYLIQE